MNAKRILTMTCVLAGAWVGIARADATEGPDWVEFKIADRYRPGHVSRLMCVTKTVGAMKLFDPMPEQKFMQTFCQEVAMRVTKVNPDKSVELELTMPRIRMEMSLFGVEMSFDSHVPAEQKSKLPGMDFVAAMFKGMTGLKMTCTIGPDGMPQKLEGFSEGIKKMLADIGKEESIPPMVQKMLDQMGDFVHDDMMLEQMESNCRLTPLNRRLGVGDTWQREWSQAMGFFNMMMNFKGEYELLGIEPFRGRRCAKIRTKESFESAPAADRTKSGTIFDRMDMKMTSSGGNGVAYVDCRTAEVVKLRQTQRMTIEMTFAADPQAEDPEMQAGFGTMVQKLNNSVSLDLIEEGDDPWADIVKAAATTAPAAGAADAAVTPDAAVGQ
ncbi:MAG TPA: DUF6263 family protein [Phycisphaerae bacterium]|nr:DUF6263 family protein [Phycisphaerae bacterium]